MTTDNRPPVQVLQQLNILRDHALVLQSQTGTITLGRELLKFVNALTTSLSGPTLPPDILARLLAAILHLESLDCGGIYTVNPTTGELTLAAHTGLSPQFVAKVSHYAANAPHTRLVMTGQPVYHHYPQMTGILKNIHPQEGLKALAIVPVLHCGQVVAVLNMASHTHDDISEPARHTLEAIAALGLLFSQ